VIRVSSEAEISDDEADDLGNSSNDDSFIDDRINPTVASADSKASRADMMAVYRFLTPRQSISCACPCVLGLNLRYIYIYIYKLQYWNLKVLAICQAKLHVHFVF
jgi:hypothetical protein